MFNVCPLLYVLIYVCRVEEVITVVVVVSGSLASLSMELTGVCLVLPMLLLRDHSLRKLYRLFRVLQLLLHYEMFVDRAHKDFAGFPPHPFPALISVPRFPSR